MHVLRMPGDRTPCPGCGARFPASDGPTHRYMESSPGCWAAYGQVLAREYENAAAMSVHQLTVDAYAVQHPGVPGPQAIQSVGIHLATLHLFIDEGVPLIHGSTLHKRGAALSDGFHWLTPPADWGQVTVADVVAVASVPDHREMVWKWARSAWAAWAEHHETVRGWAARIRSGVV